MSLSVAVFVVSHSALAEPAIDGVVSQGEWYGAPTAATTRFEDGWIVTRIDAGKLFLLADVLGDSNDDGICNNKYPPKGDWLEFLFDTDSNGELGAGVDHGYRASCNAQNTIAAYRCFRCRPNDQLMLPTHAVLRMGFGPTPKSSTPHRFWELSIPVAELTGKPSINAWLSYKSENPELEAIFGGDKGFMIPLTDAPPPATSHAQPQSRLPRQVRVTEDGAIEIKLPQVTRTLNTNGTVSATYANGAQSQESAAEAVTPDIPVSPEMNQWLVAHAEELLNTLRVLVQDDVASIANLRSAEATLSIQKKIAKRVRAIRFLVTP